MPKKPKSGATHGDVVVCTAVSKNYLPVARVLAQSLRTRHPEIEVFVLLVDRIDDCFDPADEPFTVVEVETLDNIPHPRHLFFRYNLLELNTAVKPYFFECLFRDVPCRKLIYFDPDIMVTDSLDELFSLLEDHDAVLTPHMTDPYEDHFHPGELDILRAGVYNLGFLGMRRCEPIDRFLKWWQDRLYRYCTMEPDKGIHVDQKWVDFLPLFFDRVHILKDPGYNAAYWNLHGRDLQVRDGKVEVNGRPLRFFHFSGFSPDWAEGISKHQDRFNLFKLPALRPLFESYRNRVLANGFRTATDWPYAFARYDNGEEITEEHRRWYRDLGEAALPHGDPFAAEGSYSFHHLTTEIEKDIAHCASLLPRHVSVRQRDVRDDIAERHLADVRKAHEVRTAADGAGNGEAVRASADFGVNVAGYISGDFGVGEAARCLLRALQVGRVPVALKNLRVPWHNTDERRVQGLDGETPYPVNIVCVNADMVPVFHEEVGPGFFAGRHNIGTWFWELSCFPERWRPSFAYFQELWVASQFCAEALSKASPIPVVKITYPIEVDIAQLQPERGRFGLRPDTFVFLFAFDFHSLMERKNPEALIRAFAKAFSPDEDGALLVLKTLNSAYHPEKRERLMDAINGHRVMILDGHLPQEEMLSLYATADAYVSLHRTEGLGLPLAKCMYLGKPVIATGYSGNMDFMNVNNSFPVKFDLVELDRDYGPYEKGNVWAEPDEDHAAEVMRRVYDDRALGEETGRRAAADIRAAMSPEAGYRTLEARLHRIAEGHA